VSVRSWLTTFDAHLDSLPPLPLPHKSKQTPMKVTIDGRGVLQGTTVLETATQNPKCHRFSSIPYALPPTGKRRWRKPDPLPRNFSYGTEQSPGNFVRPSSPCPQLPNFGVKPSNEDCLQCNIWVPIGKLPTRGWPVLFWIRMFPIQPIRQMFTWNRWRLFTIWVQQFRRPI